MFDSIVNVNDFFSSHWLAESFPAKLKDLNKVWKERSEHGKHSPLRQLAISAGGFLARRAELPGPDEESFVEELTALHAVLLAAMGYQAEPTTLETEQAGTLIEIPLLARIQGPGAESLHVLQARPVDSLDGLFGENGELVEPILVRHSETKTEEVRGIADAVQLLFLTEQAPRYLLIMAGSRVVVSDVERWAEGRYLAFDMDTAMSRRDDKPTGELAWHAGLWSSDVLLPADDGSTAIEEFSRDSVKHAVGVSADLREGLRTSVELIANAVIVARRQRGEMVEGDTELPSELTRQSLRFLYRILFLLFAESRPELGVLPFGAIEYGSGYGLDRFRDLVQRPLTTEQALRGTHLHDSLRLLFRLVNEGHNQRIEGGDGLIFEPLRADLFEPAKARLVDEIDLPNELLQEVLGLLLLSKPTKRRPRGYVSYAQLGINQLGAVYEGLMSYSGFIAAQRVVELAKDGDADKGTWLVPAENVGDYDKKHLVLREHWPSGTKTKVTHEKGTFVYRLSGRDRQRSASYYTPEVLTRTVVKHALAELITEETTAAEILEYRICEPALGSGAFLNEAINQLARTYLERRQRELDEAISPDDFQGELLRVKAYLALHQAYGVDLNQTAVELAEVSLWLNVMHPGLHAPWFGLHLRRGNSLIGARRATYNLAALGRAKQRYWMTAPTNRPLRASGGTGNLSADEVHHFLLPAAGWGAVGDAQQAKDLAPEGARALRDWRKSILRHPDRTQAQRLRGLARRVERMWELTRRRLEISEREVARRIEIWGRQSTAATSTVAREQVERALNNVESPYQRLRLVMGLWCALFYCPPIGPKVEQPTLDEWISTLERILGVQGRATKGTTVDDLASSVNDLDSLGDLDENERVLYGMRPIVEIVAANVWVGTGIEIAHREGFFHWELDLAHVFGRGGFDLLLGNPPWVRLDWVDDLEVSEVSPQLLLSSSKLLTRPQRTAIIESALRSSFRQDYLARLTRTASSSAHLLSPVWYPEVAGTSGNIYMNFMVQTWRLLSSTGVGGLLHPDDHLVGDRTAKLRSNAYPRLRRHFGFVNELQLFTEVSHTTEYGLSIYAAPRQIEFTHMSKLYHPDTIEGSLSHDGQGERPGMQLPWGGWDVRPHLSRVVRVNMAVLEAWSSLFDKPGTPPAEARLLSPVVGEQANALVKMGQIAERMDGNYFWTRCWDEDKIKSASIAEWDTSQPESFAGLVLQPSHVGILDPFVKQPRSTLGGDAVFERVDLNLLAEDFIPRTNYRIIASKDKYLGAIRRWNGAPVVDFWRLAWRRRVGQNMARTHNCALIPPGTAHVHTVQSCSVSSNALANGEVEASQPGNNLATVVVAGLWASLPFDFLVKVNGSEDVSSDMVDNFPMPINHPAADLLMLRVLRLNCLTRAFAPLWEEAYTPDFLLDSWTVPHSEWPRLASVQPLWTEETPIRTEFERRAALVEIDALAAVMLGLSADELALMFTGQFGVLRKYEYTMWFDNRGDRIAKETHARGIGQQTNDYRYLLAYNDGQPCGDLLERYEPPFVKVDREAEMRAAHAEFTERLGL